MTSVIDIPTGVSGNAIPSSGWNAMRDALQAGAWGASATDGSGAAVSLNTVGRNFDVKTSMSFDLTLNTNVITSTAQVTVLADSVNPPVATGGVFLFSVGVVGSQSIIHARVFLNPNAFFKFRVDNSGNGVTLANPSFKYWT